MNVLICKYHQTQVHSFELSKGMIVQIVKLFKPFRSKDCTFVVLPKKECNVLDGLYERIQSECKKKNITVSKMCVMLGISKGTLSALKNGITKSLSAPTAMRIAEFLGVSVDYLLDGEEKETPLVNGDEELTELLERARDDPNIRMLFSITKDAKPEDIERAIKIIQALKEGS